ncbi:MAG TPA: hypothetical protein VGY77_01890 [Gemmataceae bacterium]|nr:hypothetical protein [Gemmataceae bacterium]
MDIKAWLRARIAGQHRAIHNGEHPVANLAIFGPADFPSATVSSSGSSGCLTLC